MAVEVRLDQFQELMNWVTSMVGPAAARVALQEVLELQEAEVRGIMVERVDLAALTMVGVAVHRQPLALEGPEDQDLEPELQPQTGSPRLVMLMVAEAGLRLNIFLVLLDTRAEEME